MPSLLGGVVDLVRNRAATGWSSTTYNRPVRSAFRRDTTMTRQMEIYGAVSTLFSTVSTISRSTASVKWRLYRSAKKDGRRVNAPNQNADDLGRTEIVAHPALSVWEKPNDFYTQHRLIESFEQHVELTGEARLVIARNPASAMPLELWPVRPDRIVPVPSRETFLAGYIYTGPNGDDTIPLEVDQVISVIMPNPLDPYRGLGPVQALVADLEGTKAAADWNANFFKNDASPGGLIELEQRLSDAEFDEFTERWRSSHLGVQNAHRVAILENGAKWKDRQFTQRDMQFAELRGLTRELIREAFGMHGHMLGLTDDINRANAEAATEVFSQWVLRPRLERIRDALNSQLLPLFGTSGDGMEFDFDDPSPEESEAKDLRLESKARAADTLIKAGFDRKAVLETVGLPDMDERDGVDDPPLLPAGFGKPGEEPPAPGDGKKEPVKVPA